MKNFNYVLNLQQHEKSLLVARSSRVIRSFLASEVEDGHSSVTFMEWLVLGLAVDSGSKGLTMSEAAAMLDVTLPQVTAIANRLIEHKLVVQKVEAKDRRARRLRATSKGKKIIRAKEEQITEAIREWLYKDTGLTFDDMNHFFYVLNQISCLSAQKTKEVNGPALLHKFRSGHAVAHQEKS